ncbi:ethylene-responsive transcription factor ERF020 [Carica papaya]|uniref:ethylene-responsive transcription factor ERF020 n=1 Tax=Carica papaya TaxID=3649 RepID=UPI000B8C7AF2|nr:ethylene-responsive transcription factor ERF020 [Carica papaya]
MSNVQAYELADSAAHGDRDHKKYKGVRRRRWGKWVSEIRVPGTQQRLWLGSYSTPEAAAVAHDIAYYCLRRPSSFEALNFPLTSLPAACANGELSPRSVQRAASDAAMAVDARMVVNGLAPSTTTELWVDDESSRNSLWEAASHEQVTVGREALSISVEDYF